MKFFLECVSCCRNTTEPTHQLPPPATSPRSEETRSLVLQPLPRSTTSRIRHRKRRSSRSSVGEWRPSLFAISEENDTVSPDKVMAEKKRAIECGRQPKRCAVVSTSQTHGRNRFGRDPLPMVVPAFAPTPFMI
ncbi:hypothetical protein Ancab_025239 [Ancistrocladus abbreviatus]